jgi:hypothetical protein
LSYELLAAKAWLTKNKAVRNILNMAFTSLKKSKFSLAALVKIARFRLCFKTNAYYEPINIQAGNKKALRFLVRACFIWSWRWDSNPRPADYKLGAPSFLSN